MLVRSVEFMEEWFISSSVFFWCVIYDMVEIFISAVKME